MSTDQSNNRSNPFEDECSPFTPIRNAHSSRFTQEGQAYILSPPPAPKASQRAYRLSNDERKKQDLSQIARKLTFDDHEEDEKKNYTLYPRNGCHHRSNHHDQDDDERPMNSVRFDGNYTFMDEVMESSLEKPSPTFSSSGQNMSTKTLGSPIRIHPDHTSPPQSSSSNSDTFTSSSSTIHGSPIDADDGAKNLRKRNHSIGQEDHQHTSPSRDFRSIQATTHIEGPKHLQAKRTRIPDTTDRSQQSIRTSTIYSTTLQHNEEDPFDSFLKPLASTPFIVQLQRTATHSGMNETSIPGHKQATFIKQSPCIEPSSAMHRSISNASYLIRTPNEVRETQSSKVVIAPRMKYNMAQRSIHQIRQSSRHNRSSSVFANSQSCNINTPSLCAPFSTSNTPSPVIANTNLPNVFPSQPIDYFGNWSAASSPLTQAH